MKTIIGSLIVLGLTGCASSAYEAGVKGNTDQYDKYVALQNKQLDNVSNCYIYAENKAECSIVAAGLNISQIMLGRGQELRIPKSPGEIFESIAKYGMDKTVDVFGQAIVSKVVQEGFKAASKDPAIVEVQPSYVRPEIIQVNPTTGASVINSETIGVGSGSSTSTVNVTSSALGE